MSEHVYVRLTGYGVAVVPMPGFMLARVSASDLPLRVASDTASAVLSDPSRAASELQGVADVAPDPAQGGWVLDTGVFSAAWPVGYTVHHDPSGPPGFYLLNGSDAFMFAQGPYITSAMLPLESMTAPGQVISDVTREGRIARVTLTYEHEGKVWLQRHHVIALDASISLVVTLQAPAETAIAALASAAPFIRSVQGSSGAA
jgi:hypothetical protein